MNPITAAPVFDAVIYLQGFRHELPVRSNCFRGLRGAYLVKLFYTSNTLIMLQSTLKSLIFLVS